MPQSMLEIVAISAARIKAMTIAIDGFGGDNAPDEVLKGAVTAADKYNVDITITGDVEILQATVKSLGLNLPESIEFVHADGVMQVEDNPVEIRTTKSGTSMGVAFDLVKTGKADAIISAGSTAALMVGGSMLIGRIKGIKRPALSPICPGITLNGEAFNYLLLDVGANLECRPEMLLQFAIMGSIYSEKVMGVARPRVGLLNIGTEEEKGRDLEHSTFALLKNAPVNFIGNVEARDVPMGICDVAVTDGFTGNIYLKAVEGMGRFMKGSMKQMFSKNAATKVGYLLSKSGVRDISDRTDYRVVGGSPLLGTAKPVIKAHGSSDALAFVNAVRQAKSFVESGVTEEIANLIQRKC